MPLTDKVMPAKFWIVPGIADAVLNAIPSAGVSRIPIGVDVRLDIRPVLAFVARIGRQVVAVAISGVVDRIVIARIGVVLVIVGAELLLIVGIGLVGGRRSGRRRSVGRPCALRIKRYGNG